MDYLIILRSLQFTLIAIDISIGFYGRTRARQEHREINEKTFRDLGSGFVVEWECLCRTIFN